MILAGRRLDRGILFLIAGYLAALPVLARPFIDGVDSVGYYSWLRSAVFDHDLDVANEFEFFETEIGEEFRAELLGRTTPTGYRHNQLAAGSALLWLPPYALAHALVSLANAAGSALQADGYGWPYQAAASLGSGLYGLAGVLLTYRIVRDFFDPFIATLATLVAWFATPLVFYMFSHPLMSHANDAFACTLIIWAWRRCRKQPSPGRTALVGLAIGLATWVRTQNAAFLAAALAVMALGAVEAVGRGERSLGRTALGRVAGLGAGFAIAFIPLMFFWREVFGAWLVSTYAPEHGGAIFDWRAPHLLSVLFSTNRGLFVWAPATAIGLVGLGRLWRYDRRLTVFVGAMLVAQLYIVSSWHGWHGGSAFGPRFWSNMLTPSALGLAALIADRPGLPRWALVAGGSLFVIWNGLLIVQYSLQTIPRSGPVDLADMIRNQFLVVPQNLARVIRALLDRR